MSSRKPRNKKELIAQIASLEVAAYTRRQLDDLTKIYKKAERDWTSRLLALTTTGMSVVEVNRSIRAIKISIKAVEEATKSWADTVVPLSYDRGLDVADRQIIRLGVADSVNKNTAMHAAAIASITSSTVLDMMRATKQTERALTQYVQMSRVPATKDSRKVTALRKAISSGSYVSINGRSYNLVQYMKLVAQTRTRDAVTEATVNAALQYGMDLVMWDIHDNACTKCQPFLGRVFSISGKHPDYPFLARRPALHPLCECTIHPINEEVLRETGMYDRVLALSNNPDVAILGRGSYDRILGKEPMDIAAIEAGLVRGAA